VHYNTGVELATNAKPQHFNYDPAVQYRHNLCFRDYTRPTTDDSSLRSSTDDRAQRKDLNKTFVLFAFFVLFVIKELIAES